MIGARQFVCTYLVGISPWIQTEGIYDAKIQSSIGTHERISSLPQLRRLIVVLLKLLVVPSQGADGGNKTL